MDNNINNQYNTLNQDPQYQTHQNQSNPNQNGTNPATYTEISNKSNKPRSQLITEDNIGKYIIGIFASILIILQAQMFVSLFWNDVAAIVKYAIVMLIGITVWVIPTLKLFPKEADTKELNTKTKLNGSIHNGFLLALQSCGSVIVYIGIIQGNTLWNLYQEIPTLLITTIWFAATMFIQINIYQIIYHLIQYVGGIMFIMLWCSSIGNELQIPQQLIFVLATLSWVVISSVSIKINELKSQVKNKAAEADEQYRPSYMIKSLVIKNLSWLYAYFTLVFTVVLSQDIVFNVNFDILAVQALLLSIYLILYQDKLIHNNSILKEITSAIGILLVQFPLFVQVDNIVRPLITDDNALDIVRLSLQIIIAVLVSVLTRERFIRTLTYLQPLTQIFFISLQKLLLNTQVTIILAFILLYTGYKFLFGDKDEQRINKIYQSIYVWQIYIISNFWLLYENITQYRIDEDLRLEVINLINIGLMAGILTLAYYKSFKTIKSSDSDYKIQLEHIKLSLFQVLYILAIYTQIPLYDWAAVFGTLVGFIFASLNQHIAFKRVNRNIVSQGCTNIKPIVTDVQYIMNSIFISIIHMVTYICLIFWGGQDIILNYIVLLLFIGYGFLRVYEQSISANAKQSITKFILAVIVLNLDVNLFWMYLTQYDTLPLFISIIQIIISCICILYGFKVKNQLYRITGLVLLILYVIKILAFDLIVMGASTLLHIQLLFISGVFCFLISYIYNKIDKIQK